jgi:hypothetical protein
LGQQYADLWRAQVKLYRVPFVHIGSAPWGEGQIHFICQIDPKPEAAGQRLGEDIVQNPNPHMWIPYNGPEPYDEVCHLCGAFSGLQATRSSRS